MQPITSQSGEIADDAPAPESDSAELTLNESVAESVVANSSSDTVPDAPAADTVESPQETHPSEPVASPGAR